MTRVKIKFPDEKPLATISIPVRITDINYGNHLGNDRLLSIIHEARMQLLSQWGYTELDAGGVGMIMADVMIAYRGEAFYGDVLTICIYAAEVADRSFDLLYHISTERNGSRKDIAHAKTGMVTYDYKTARIAVLSTDLKNHLAIG
ncbi:MAG: thioesterase [Sphingobacteriales bacterium]|nr:MAG: thioesterase [Sphingobacteriales bacterium]